MRIKNVNKLFFITVIAFCLNSCKQVKNRENDTRNSATGCPAKTITKAAFNFKNKTLFVTTNRYGLEWKNGCMVKLTTLLPKRQLLTVNNVMDQFDLPNGIGSYTDSNQKSVETLHIGKYGQKLGKKKGMKSDLLSSFHPVSDQTRVQFKKTKSGAILTYKGLLDEPKATLVQEFKIDSMTGDLLIRQTAESETPGVYGYAFSILNLHRNLRFIVPYFEGQVISPKNSFWGIGFGHFWQFSLIVAEIPGGGSFYVFADDPDLNNKYLRILDSDISNARALNFESIASPPFEKNKSFTSFTWRFNTFGGGWHDPARRYKKWLTETYKVKSIKKRPVPWPEKTSLIIPNVSSCNPDILAREIGRPETLLFHIYNWAKGFNRYAPYYQPKGNLNSLKAKMDKIGAKWGLYFSLGVMDVNAYPKIFRDYRLLIAKDYMRIKRIEKCLAIQKKLWNGDISEFKPEKGRNLQYIQPGNRKWRELYAEIMADEVKKYQIPLLYQDVCGSSVVCPKADGLTYGQGMVEGTKQIRLNCPQQALSAEFRTEVSFAAGYDFGATDYGIWFGGGGHHKALGKNAHPMMGFIIDDFIKYFNFQDTHQKSPAFHWSMNAAEVIGFLPTWIGNRNEPIAGAARLNLERAKLFAQGFRSYFPEKYEKDVAGYMRHSDGRLIKYVRSGDCSYCFLFENGKKKLCYGRVHGVRTVSPGEPVHIDGWIAYRDGGPIGLDPKKWYCVFPGSTKETPVLITDIPKGLFISQSLLFPKGGALVSFDGKGEGMVKWQTADGSKAERLVRTGDSILLGGGELLDLTVNKTIQANEWHRVGIRGGRVLGEVKGKVYPKGFQQLKNQPVAILQAPPGGPGSELCLYRLVKLPKGKSLTLSGKFFKYSCPGDGMNIHVDVNGKTIWSTKLPPKGSELREFSVPLSEYAGETIMLSIAVDCASTINTSGDIVYLGNVVLR